MTYIRVYIPVITNRLPFHTGQRVEILANWDVTLYKETKDIKHFKLILRQFIFVPRIYT